MPRVASFTPTFVEYVPDKLEDGRLYIAIALRTIVHRCACGCGREVATPISPEGWQMTYDGRTVSLNPSIGNWSYPCRSHYWIQENRVEWAAAWTDAQVIAARGADRVALARRRSLRGRAVTGGAAGSPERSPSLLRRLMARLGSNKKTSE